MSISDKGVVRARTPQVDMVKAAGAELAGRLPTLSPCADPTFVRHYVA